VDAMDSVPRSEPPTPTHGLDVLQIGRRLNRWSRRANLFQKRHFAAEVIVTCVRWYLRFSLSLRDIEELMAERGLSVDHTTVWRWPQNLCLGSAAPAARATQAQRIYLAHR
jgi:hypothetical protein